MPFDPFRFIGALLPIVASADIVSRRPRLVETGSVAEKSAAGMEKSMHHYVSGRAELETTFAGLVSLSAPRLRSPGGVGHYRTQIVWMHHAEVRWPTAALSRSHLLTVVLVGAGIDDLRPHPPFRRWKCPDRLCASARVAIVRGPGREARCFRIAVAATQRFRRLAPRPDEVH
jgi:hypothetical protein